MALAQPRLRRRPHRAVDGVRTAHNDSAGAIAQLARQVRGRVHGRAGRVHATGGDDAVKETRQRRLPRGHDHDDVIAAAVDADAVLVAQEVGELLGEDAGARLGQAVLGRAGFGVEERVLVGAGEAVVCEGRARVYVSRRGWVGFGAAHQR